MPPTILVVDDSPADRTLITSTLQTGGRYQIETAKSAEEALFRLARGGIDLLVTEYMMPGLDGLCLCQKAVEFDPTLRGRVLIVTAGMYGREEALAFAASTDVLTKPFATGTLLTAVEDLLSRPRSRPREE